MPISTSSVTVTTQSGLYPDAKRIGIQSNRCSAGRKLQVPMQSEKILPSGNQYQPATHRVALADKRAEIKTASASLLLKEKVAESRMRQVVLDFFWFFFLSRKKEHTH